MKTKILSSFILLAAFMLLMIGCEAENPGEPLANIAPETYISEASPGNTTVISFYGTDKDGFVDMFSYRWDSDNEWTESEVNTVSFVNVFENQTEVKTFYVKGIDDAGEEDPTPAEIALTATNALPITVIIEGPEFGKVAGEDVRFTFSGEDVEADGSISAFEYTMDDLNNWRTTDVDHAEATYLGLNKGAHTFYVRAVDNLGGADPTPAQVAFLVESAVFSPTLVNHSPLGDGDGWYADITIPFQWDAITADYYGILADEPYSVGIDDSTNYDLNPYTALASGWTSGNIYEYTPPQGTHTFYLKVRDTAGGVSLMKISLTAAVPTFANGILVVNGVLPGSAGYGSEIEDKLNSGAYWGSFNVDFVDLFGSSSAPGGTINLPASATYLGNGSLINAEFLGQYSTIVWLGNDYQGDGAYWSASLAYAYASAGGNMILTSRYGETSFFNTPLTGYANIAWRGDETAGEYVPCFPGLVSMEPFLSSMSATSVFSGGGFMTDSGDEDLITNWDGTSSFTKEDMTTTMLFVHRNGAYDPSFGGAFATYCRGLGVWAHPNLQFSSQTAADEFPIPGSDEAKGNFIYLAGRHYRFDVANCTANFDFMIRNMCGEQ